MSFEPMIGTADNWPRPQSARPHDAADFWYRDVTSPSEAGVIVNDEKSLAVATFFACLRVLSQSIASMPIMVYRWLAEGGKERATDSEWYTVLHDRPNVWQTPAEWKQLGMAWLILRGNWYCRIRRGLGQIPTQLIPLNPDRVKPQQMENGQIRYRFQPDNAPAVIYNSQDILHIRGLSLDGVVGVSVLTYARNALGLSIAQETHGSKLFANGSLPPFALETPEQMNERAIINFRAGWRGMHGGAKNAHNPPILQGGMKIHELSLTNEDSQWLESRRFQAEEICRFTGVPPHMAGILDRATFSNIEHQGIDYVRYTIRPWTTLWQQSINRDLIAEDDLFSEFLLDDLQRGDTGSRYGAYNVGLQAGFLTRNEVRNWENLNPIEGGDTPLEPLNMGPIGQRNTDPPQQMPAKELPSKSDDSDEDDAPKQRRKRRRGSKQRMRAFRPILNDAASRIASREYLAMSGRLAKYAENPARWIEWASEWYDGHQSFMVTTLTPIAETVKTMTGRRVMVAHLAESYCQDAVRQLSERDPGVLLNEWKEIRSQQTASWLQGEFFDVPTSA